MGIKRVVDTEFWEDDKVEEMTPEEKYFWLYLLTNPYTKQLGIYKITRKQMSFHLGYDVETVSKLLDRFENKYNLIRYEENEIAIKNFLRHSILKGGKPVEDCLNADIKNVKHKNLIEWVFKEIDMSKVSDTVSKVIRSYINDNDNDIHNDDDNDNDSIVNEFAHDSSTIRLIEAFGKETIQTATELLKPYNYTEKDLIALASKLFDGNIEKPKAYVRAMMKGKA